MFTVDAAVTQMRPTFADFVCWEPCPRNNNYHSFERLWMQNLCSGIQCALLPTVPAIIITVYLHYGRKTSVMKTIHQSQIASVYPFSSPRFWSNHNSFCLNSIKCFRATISTTASLSIPLSSHKVSILTSKHHHQCPGYSFLEVS